MTEKPIGQNAKLQTVWFGSVIGEPDCPTVFHRPYSATPVPCIKYVTAILLVTQQEHL